MRSMKKTFHIPPSYVFTAGCSNPATVISLAPFVSSCSSPLNYVGGLRPFYQQQKFRAPSDASTRSSSSLSLATIGVHSTDDDPYATAPSSPESDDDSITGNPFEALSKREDANSAVQVRCLSFVRDDRYSVAMEMYLLFCCDSRRSARRRRCTIIKLQLVNQKVCRLSIGVRMRR